MHNETTKALYDIFPTDEKGNFYHAYMYLKHLNHFIYHAMQAAGDNPTKMPDTPISDDVKEMLEAVVQDIADGAASRDTSIYHGKIVKLKDAIQLVTQKLDLSIEPSEKVIPYKQAKNIILQNPESIAVGECACRAINENSCLGPDELDVCLFVGDPQAAFIAENNPKFRKCSQEEAVRIIEDAHKRGFVHGAYFKKDMSRRFVAICNCCACCCQGMKAWNLYEGAIPVLAPSGYVAEVSDECIECGDCEEACGFNAITMDGMAVINEEKCMGCGVCEGQCPNGAISLKLDPSKGEPLDLEVLKKEAK